jgi:hypothetical protein
MRIKLPVVVTDLFGASGLLILHALAQDETDPKNLALLGGSLSFFWSASSTAATI